MYTSVSSCIVIGVDGKKITVEVDISHGLPHISIVGLPDISIRESIDRVRSAIKNSQFKFPQERITVNLAPADLRKEGTGLDLAICISILIASGQISAELFEGALIVGELALNGKVRPVKGLLAMLEYAVNHNYNHVIIPYENMNEARLISGLRFTPIKQITDLTQITQASSLYIKEIDSKEAFNDTSDDSFENLDIADIKGQQTAKRALLIAASGRHNLILSGPPGIGKTMLIRRLPSLLPPLDEASALEVTKIYSVAGKLNSLQPTLIKSPPFRSPHHSTSIAGLIGGGSVPKPGEITLAHHGILFLDELPEFPRHILELLRQPLEDRTITISRARTSVTFPAKFVLAAAFNPCPCGYFGFEQEHHYCSCTPQMIQRYRSKISGPLLDRIDIQLEMTRPSVDSVASGNNKLTTNILRLQAKRAVEFQQERNKSYGCQFNSDLSSKALHQVTTLSKECSQFLHKMFETYGISLRAQDKLLKIARTIADLELSETISMEHLAEAMQYRKLDINLQ